MYIPKIHRKYVNDIGKPAEKQRKTVREHYGKAKEPERPQLASPDFVHRCYVDPWSCKNFAVAPSAAASFTASCTQT